MAILAILMAIETVAMRLLLVADLQVDRLKHQATAMGLNIVLNLFLIPKFGVLGALWASILSHLAMLLLYYGALRSITEVAGLEASVLKFVGTLGVVGLIGWILILVGPREWLAAVGTLLSFGILAAITGLVPIGGLRRT